MNIHEQAAQTARIPGLAFTLDGLTAEAIEAAARAAGHAWNEAARAAVSQLASAGEPFTTDDVWEALERTGSTVAEPRALGAIMRGAVRSGSIVALSHRVPSRRPNAHQRPVSVYQAARHAGSTTETWAIEYRRTDDPTWHVYTEHASREEAVAADGCNGWPDNYKVRLTHRVVTAWEIQ